MNALALLFLIASVVGLLAVPRQWAPLPLIAGACYMTLAQGFNLGPLSFTVLRILILVGFIRVFVRREAVSGRMNGIDWCVVGLIVWTVFSSVFHEDRGDGNPWIFRLGFVFNVGGVYFLIRVFCQTEQDVVRLIKITAILLVPVALEMVSEKIVGRNAFSVLGGVSPFPPIREGKLRAQGPFTSAILAGTVGAVCFPFMVALLRRDRKFALAGAFACFAMVLASASSGPVMSFLAALGALAAWRFRHFTSCIRWAAVGLYFLCELFTKAPAVYLLARIDISGGSTGWHRAHLMTVAVEHLGEWWLGGSDYTKHWMSTGVSWSPNHVDLTNYYIWVGIIAGLPLMFLVIALIWKGFSYVGQIMRMEGVSEESQFLIWALGASLFAHAATFIAVAYTDQSFLFFYSTVAVIASMRSFMLEREGEAIEMEVEPVKNGGVPTSGGPAERIPGGRTHFPCVCS